MSLTIIAQPLLPAVRFLAAGAIALAAADGAEHWQVDQPDDWYRPDVSHHGRHGLGGAVIGAASYAAVRIAGGSRGDGYAVAALDGAIAGMGYELIEGRSGRSWVDPVDAAWVEVGALAGAAVADLTGQAVVAVMPRRDGVAITGRFHF